MHAWWQHSSRQTPDAALTGRNTLHRNAYQSPPLLAAAVINPEGRHKCRQRHACLHAGEAWENDYESSLSECSPGEIVCLQ